MNHLINLLASLPEAGSTDVGDEARMFLRTPLSLALSLDDVASVIPSTPCANCDQQGAVNRASPYCSQRCRDMSSLVRQFRAALPTPGLAADRDKQIAFAQMIWFLMGGGLPYRNSLIPDRAYVRFFEKNPYCDACGAAATTVDHLKTFCNRPINLRPMCEPCAVTRHFGDEKVMEAGYGVLIEIAQRLRNKLPVRCCDDQATWDWRAFLKSRLSTP